MTIRSRRGRIAGPLALLAAASLALAGCGPRTFVVGIEPSPAPTPTSTPVVVRYVNDEYGFAFHYPQVWALTEGPQQVTLSHGTSVLHVAYGWQADPGFMPLAGRTGLPAGDLVYRDKIPFLEQPLPAHVLVHEQRDKLVIYGSQGLATVGDLALSIWLEDASDADYADVDIADAMQAQVREVLGSFERTEASGQPPAPTPSPAAAAGADALTYTNDERRFTFTYPAGWTIEEVPGGSAEGDVRLADAVVLRQDPFAIVVQYQHTSEAGQVAWGGDLLPGGMGYAEATMGAPLTLLGEETRKLVWTYDGETRAIEVNTTGKGAALLLSITLADSSADLIQDDDAEPVPDAAIAALDQVLSSFTLGEQ